MAHNDKMNWLHERIRRLATWPVVALLFCVCVGCTAGFDIVQERLGLENQILDVRGWYTPEEADRLFGDLGREGRRTYTISALTLDVVFPLAYGLLLAVLVVQLYPRRAGALLVLPVCAAGADLLENVTIAYLLWTYDGETALAWMAAALTAGKFALLLASLVVVLLGGVLGLRSVSATSGPRD